MTHPRSPFDGAGLMARGLALLDAYGADPARWPAEERSVFAALAGESRFEAARAEAAALDAALGAAPAVAAGEGLSAAILAQFSARAATAPQLDALIGLGARGFGRLAPLAIAAGLSAAGFVIGLASANVGTGGDEALYYALDTSMIAIAEDAVLGAEDL